MHIADGGGDGGEGEGDADPGLRAANADRAFVLFQR